MRTLSALALAAFIVSIVGCRPSQAPGTQEPAQVQQIGQADPKTGAIPRSMGTSESNP
ncbi:MAG: hypothetical protein AMXMBFR81_03460 [Chthonomonas sp.]|nr:hypothetical protein [Fimbriimonadaceae bacterium]